MFLSGNMPRRIALPLLDVLWSLHLQTVRQEEGVEVAEAGIANGLVERDLGCGLGLRVGGLLIGRHACSL
jgi:hypothetical protein